MAGPRNLVSDRRAWLENALPRLLRRERVALFIGYLLVQGVIVAGLTTPRYPDSGGYLQLSFIGRYDRPWTVPLLYTIFPTDSLRIAAQVVLAAASWWFLANAASRLVRDRYVRLGVRVVLLMLGVVGPVASWNSTILSDSAAISLTALLIGCWIRHASRPSRTTALSLLAVTLLWSFTRNDLILVGAGITVCAVVAVTWRWRSRVNALLACGLIVISAYGLAVDNRNPYILDENIASVIEGRILDNPGWRQWFIAHGMPYSVGVQDTQGGLYGLALLQIPVFHVWLTASGASTYAEFLLEHPAYTLLDPLPDFSGELASINWPNRTAYAYTQPNPSPSMLSPTANYGRHRDVLPSVIQDLLFQQGQIGDVLLLAVGAFGLAWVARRKLGSDSRMWVPFIAIAFAIAQGYLVWFAGDAEIDRHAIVLATTARIGLWIVAGYALDRLIQTRQTRAPAH